MADLMVIIAIDLRMVLASATKALAFHILQEGRMRGLGVLTTFALLPATLLGGIDVHWHILSAMTLLCHLMEGLTLLLSLVLT
jgi:hypothetical protein